MPLAATEKGLLKRDQRASRYDQIIQCEIEAASVQCAICCNLDLVFTCARARFRNTQIAISSLNRVNSLRAIFITVPISILAHCRQRLELLLVEGMGCKGSKTGAVQDGAATLVENTSVVNGNEASGTLHYNMLRARRTNDEGGFHEAYEVRWPENASNTNIC